MKYIKLSVLLLISAFTLKANSECHPNTACAKPRDVINYSLQTTDVEINAANEIWWKIKPMNAGGNILLAFKEFSLEENDKVTVQILKQDNNIEIEYYRGTLENFEVIASNVRDITINVTNHDKNTFVLHYYGDCNLVTQNPITSNDLVSKGVKCAILVPNITEHLNQIYFTIRNTVFPEGINLQIQDIHSSILLKNVSENVFYDIVGFESTTTSHGMNSFYFLIDLKCSTDSCNYTESRFLLSHYVLSETDISCAKDKKRCYQLQGNTSTILCKGTCPAITAIIEQEHLYEISAPIRITDQHHASNLRVKKSKKFDCTKYPKICKCKTNVTDKQMCLKTTACRTKFRTDFSCLLRCVVVKVVLCSSSNTRGLRLI